MIITLKADISAADLKTLEDFLGTQDYSSALVKTQQASYIVAIGKKNFDIRRIGKHAGVADIHRVSDAYKLVSRKWKAAPTVITLENKATISSAGLSIIAGPCSIETEEQVQETVNFLKNQGVRLMRGGAFKPRTSPYSFQGHGTEGLKMFHSLANAAGIAVVTEIVSVRHLEEMLPYTDIFQVGTRNAQNFDLLHALGGIHKPVLLKRGMSQTLEELLQSAEYIFSKGNEQIILCERGIRTFEKAYRNTLDLNAIPVLKEKTHLPVIVDPSHGVGVKRFVEPLALAGIMAGADGVIVEIHPFPDKALSDADQTLSFEEGSQLFEKLRKVYELRCTL